jgi:hypothetical protein
VFERFTERARQVVVLAQEEARGLLHNYIGTEHILLGLLREKEGLAARVLETFDITVERVRDQVTRIVGSGDEATPGQIPFTPRAKKVLELAHRESLSLGHNYIGTEHILLALVREHEGVATRILLDFDADPERVRGEVTRMLSGPSRGPRVSIDDPRPVRLNRGRRGLDPRFGHPEDLPEPAIDWPRASLMWRPEGLELRVPLNLNDGAIATFAADEVWSSPPLQGLRREIWRGWLALASGSLLDEIDPIELRRMLDEAAKRALDVGGRERGRVEDFLRRLRQGD